MSLADIQQDSSSVPFPRNHNYDSRSPWTSCIQPTSPPSSSLDIVMAEQCPEPTAAGPDLKERGIRIGDVSYFDEDHPLHRLFNITVYENHPYNSGGVPVGFTLVQFLIHLLSVNPGFLDPNLCSKSVNIKSRGVDVLA
ncbi:hypothetical protein PHLCEN_2v4850 [Hermanssonia centrifuga]|uniref:Uncharacterized protein n=1 Tax=Hermanssonia centrifuga TaxID=98765 RepID=A0A2R6PG72_9APHY|nr:hypothetical protein PHLCEN_2v4850 [Hermanssonia centrifuga]